MQSHAELHLNTNGHAYFDSYSDTKCEPFYHVHRHLYSDRNTDQDAVLAANFDPHVQPIHISLNYSDHLFHIHCHLQRDTDTHLHIHLLHNLLML